MKNILFINRKEQKCGIYQYGHRVINIISRSSKYVFIYCELDSLNEFENIVKIYKPVGIIYNYIYDYPFYWLTINVMRNYSHIKHYKLCHEDNVSLLFDYFINDMHSRPVETSFNTTRPIFEKLDFVYNKNEIPIIGTFGFAFSNKDFGQLIRLVNDQFDKAIIKIHTPIYSGQQNEWWNTKCIPENCAPLATNPNIKVEFSFDFLSDADLLKFLANNTLNAFIYSGYDNLHGKDESRGYSSVIDYAISVNRPIAISKSHMFRHIYDVRPSICVEDNSLPNIIENGPSVLDIFRKKWSNEILIKEYEDMLGSTLNIPRSNVKYVYV